ncbi:MAG TPA: dickkopf-related protein, partial [Polyangiaceae bacterium]
MLHRTTLLALCPVALVALVSQLGCQGDRDSSGLRTPSTDPGDLFDSPPDDSAATGGAGGEGSSGAAGATNGDSDENPELPSIAGGHYCVISADCGPGEFCDLGECINVCESDADCEGDQACSERGRCIEAGSEDRDPAPITEKVGTVTVNPTSVQLTEDDSKLVLTLHNHSDAPLAYRVELIGPHLSIAEPRGEIDEDGILSIDVDPEGLEGLEAFGTVHIYTELGNLVVDAPIRVGMTDTYQGVLRYGSGAVPFGNASLFLELQEHNGDVEVRVDPERSLLFPESLGTAGGRGIYTVSDGLEFTL